MIGARPTLAQVQSTVGSEQWLAALALADLSDDVRTDLARWTAWGDCGTYTYDGDARTFHPDAIVDWEAWARDVEENGRGWSSSEAWPLFDLIAALTTDGGVVHPRTLVKLGSLGQQDALGILVDWASGGNNRDRGGRYKVVPA